MTTLLIADGDAARCNDLANRLQKLRPEWRIEQCSHSEQVLRHTREQNLDCVVCDCSLSGIGTDDLFRAVKLYAPVTTRIVACVDQDHETLLQTVGAGHRFFDRRSDTQVLLETIESSLCLNMTLESEAMMSYVNETTRLPAMPTIYQQMLDALATRESSLSAVATVIETDVGLSATILNIVNSAYYGLAQRVDTIAQSVSLLGVHMIKNLTLTASVFSLFKNDSVDLSRIRELNDRAMKAGALCNQFARLSRAPKHIIDQVQIAGLLGDVGTLLHLSKADADADLEAFVDFDQLGAALLRSWHMTDAVVDAVALQNKGPSTATNNNQVLHILHCLRYIEACLVDTNDPLQYTDCKSYIMQWTNEFVADQWLEAYIDMSLMSGDGTTDEQSSAA